MQFYTETEIDRIAAMLKNGQTSTAIASLMPGRTRNAIVGVVLRNPILRAIGFPPRPNRTARVIVERKRERVAKPPKPRERKVRGGIPKMPILPDKLFKEREIVVPIEPRMVSLVDLAPCDCRWPIGDPRSETFGFCGHPKAVGSYCADHAKVAKQKPIIKKRKDKRTLREAR